MKKIKRLFSLWLPVIAWASLLFYFSSIPNLKASANVAYDEIFRSLAHAGLYFLGFLFFFRALNHQRQVKIFWLPLFLTFTYGFFDEFHQRFVPTRTFQVQDLAVDFTGALLGLIMIKNKWFKLFFGSLFLLAFLVWPGKVLARDWQAVEQRIRETARVSEARIFRDPEFSQPTRDFSVGQMIYVRVETTISGNQQKTVNLLDNNKNQVLSVELQSGQGVYTVSLPAPQNAGLYYLDIKIQGEGGSYSSQENINVGDFSGTAEVLSAAKSVVQSQALEPTIAFEPQATMTPTPQNFFKALFEFLIKLYRRFI